METNTDQLTIYEDSAHQEANAWLQEARRIVVDDADTAQAAADWLVEDLTPRRKAVEEFFQPLVVAAHAAHKALTSRRAAILARFDEPERIVKQQLADWHQREVDRRAAAEAAAGAAHLLVVGEPERLSGISFTCTLKGRVVDFPALVKAASEQSHLLPLLQINDKALQGLVRSLGRAVNIPGVEVFEQQGVRRV